jgi:hypothetical protein
VARKTSTYYRFLITFIFTCIALFSGESYRPAHADTERLVLDLPMYGELVHDRLNAQAEQLVEVVINRQFRENPNLSLIQVVVVGDRHGESIPLLVTAVSRSQWQENPQVNAWTRYYSDSYALLERHGQVGTVAIATSGATYGNGGDRATQLTQPQIDRALDEDRLTGATIQENLSNID